MNATMNNTLNDLQQRFSENLDVDSINKLAGFIQDQFSKNKAACITMFDAIHRTNCACTVELERITDVKFSTIFGKFISQAIISATGVDVRQAYQDARDAKANRVAKVLEQKHNWKIIEGVPTYTEDGKTFQLMWDESKTVAQLKMDQNKVYSLAVSGFGHEWIATLIDSAVFDEL